MSFTLIGSASIESVDTASIFLAADQEVDTKLHLIPAGATFGHGDPETYTVTVSDSKVGVWVSEPTYGVIGAASTNELTGEAYNSLQVGPSYIRISGDLLETGDEIVVTWNPADPTSPFVAVALLYSTSKIDESFAMEQEFNGNPLDWYYDFGDTYPGLSLSNAELNWAFDYDAGTGPRPDSSGTLIVASAAIGTTPPFPAVWTPDESVVLDSIDGSSIFGGGLVLAFAVAPAVAGVPIEPGGTWDVGGPLLAGNYQFLLSEPSEGGYTISTRLSP